MKDNKEIWEDIEGFDGYYQISNSGRLRIPNGRFGPPNRIMKTDPSGNGYALVFLYKKDKSRKAVTVHRLVANAFIPNPENKPQVNHKNGLKTDNQIDNLEWATSSEDRQHAYDIGLKVAPNGERHYSAKLNSFQVRVIRKSDLSQRELVRIFKVTQPTVRAIINKTTWKQIVY